jgi:hypothetical protein
MDASHVILGKLFLCMSLNIGRHASHARAALRKAAIEFHADTTYVPPNVRTEVVYE